MTRLPPPAGVESRDRSGEARRVLRLVLYMNLAVVALKLVAWWLTSALSVLAETTHSSLDALNNVIVLAFARVAARGPDEDHPYGHQKFETVGALVVVAFLSVTVFELGKGAVVRLLTGTSGGVVADPVAVAILVGSGVGGLSIATYESRRGRALASDLLLADAAHTRSDVLATVAVLVGLGMVHLGVPEADPWITLVVAVLIAYTGWQIIRETVPVLVDERAVEAQKIRRVAEGTGGVLACYGVRSRGRPGDAFVELTIAVDPGLDVPRSHDIADEVEVRIGEAVGAREVVVHVEPSA